MQTITMHVRTTEDFAGLSYYTLCRLADETRVVYPHYALPPAIERGEYEGTLTLDELGNFVSFA